METRDPPSGRVALALVVALVVVLCGVRFIALDSSPPGFYVDEAAISAQVLCLRDSGHDLAGRSWPLFADALAGGYVTPPLLYGGAAWSALFGGGVAAMRGFSALFGVLEVVAIFFFAARAFRSREAGWLAALCAAISPWTLPLSRIAWDPALAPALLGGAMALLFAQGRHARTQAALAGLVAALAAYSYPPVRVQLAIVLPMAFGVLHLRDREDARAKLLPCIATALLIAVPLIVLTLRGDIQGRFHRLSVFNEAYLAQFGEPTLLAGLVKFAQNLASNFGPGYLFVSGDANLRHATQASGEWSPLDALAVILGALGVARATRSAWALEGAGPILLFAVVGYVAGVIPAALTWQSNPHALRSVGAAVFLALASGGLLAGAWRAHRAARVAVIATAIAFGAYDLGDYFFAYPRRARVEFDAMYAEFMLGPTAGRLLGDDAARAESGLKDYPVQALRYFQMRAGLFSCAKPSVDLPARVSEE